MPEKQVLFKYALIGEDLDLKQNVSLEINKEGRISNLKYQNPGKKIEVLKNQQNNLLIPGFINSHIHIGDSFAKELGFNKSLIEIVAPPNGLKHKLLKKISNDVKFQGIINAVSEMISNGITHFVDFRERSIDGINLLKNALKNNPIGCSILGRFYNVNEIESVFSLADGIGLASYTDITKNVVDQLRFFKKKFDKPIACHVAEYKRDPTLIKNLRDENIIDIIIHGTHLISEDLEYIKNKNIRLVLCPRCNGYFGVGFPPIEEILKLQIPISLGTDNLMVNNTNLFEEMRYTYRISRVLSSKHKLSAKELLKMVTINAARNFNLQNKIGSIDKGKIANFFEIDLNAPNLYVSNLECNIIFPLIVQRVYPYNIKKTYIKGECIYERK
ncbi:MAG: amidohydrolase family protein [Promethearchaeota archaeon]